MKIKWNEEKNKQLKEERGVSFEMVAEKIECKDILDLRKHHNIDEYPDQYVFIIEINKYAYIIPFKIIDEELILITIIPSRKETKKYLG